MAQALRAATLSVEQEFEPHSIRAYFIRRGDHHEPVRYEVDRIRNGRSFVTRRVVARQAVGAILNAEASFQRPEPSAVVQTVAMPEVPEPGELTDDSWSDAFRRAYVPLDRVGGPDRDGSGRTVAWFKVDEPLGDPTDPQSQLLHRCWLAYLSDDLPTDAVRDTHPLGRDMEAREAMFGASLDHTIWFHAPLSADRWHLHDFSCVRFVGSRGLTQGYVFAPDGAHVATVAQEVLLRDSRNKK